MTTATRSVAVVATRLPNIDRRALSQAWFSALHLTQAQAGVTAPKAAPAPTARAAKALTAHAAAKPRQTPPYVPARFEGRVPRSGTVMPSVDRRSPATELSRRIERALVPHVAPAAAQPVTLAIKAGDGRVQLLVRNDGATTRVVALCAPHLRERVDRALACARFALAANGTRIEAA